MLLSRRPRELTGRSRSRPLLTERVRRVIEEHVLRGWNGAALRLESCEAAGKPTEVRGFRCAVVKQTTYTDGPIYAGWRKRAEADSADECQAWREKNQSARSEWVARVADQQAVAAKAGSVDWGQYDLVLALSLLLTRVQFSPP